MSRSDAEQFVRIDDGTAEKFYFCPDCKETGETVEFSSASGWRSHMNGKHGGVIEIDGASSVPSKGADAPATPAPAPKPKRMSAKTRELNDKTNRAINLVLKHFMTGLSEDELDELGTLRGEVATALCGIEFDFDEKLISLSSKWAILIVVVALFVLPQLPSLKELVANVKQKAAEKKRMAQDVH
jgi:hypothetical protein